MSINRRNFLASSAGLIGSAMFPMAASAQSAADFPNRMITIVVPFGAGTTTDQGARFIAQQITARTKQPVIIENKPGASGQIGTQYATTRPADGYTFMIGTNTTHAANLSLFKKLPYDPVADFMPISGVIIGGVILVVAPSNPANNVQELLAMIRKNPGKLTFGSANSSSRAGGEVMRERANVDILHVPYKTLPNALTDLMGGQIDMVFGDAPAVMPLVRAGKLKALGVSTRTRISEYPEIPTIEEQGVPGYEASGWLAAFGLKGTPPDVIAKLNSLIVPIMQMKEANDIFGKQGWTPIPGAPEELAKLQRSEIDRWASLVKSAGITPE